MKRVLIVSPHWPPVNAPDLQRVRMSLPHYADHGWRTTVLAVNPHDVAATMDPDLAATIPPEADVHLVRVDLPWLWRFVGVGSIGLRAFSALGRKGGQLLRSQAFDLIFFSNTQFITFLLGWWWQVRYGIPYIIDIQDPWRTNYYERPGAPTPPGGWKYQFARFLAWTLESIVYKKCSGFLSVSENYLQNLCQRYAWFARKPARVIHFGTSLRDLQIARGLAHGPHHFKKNPGEIHLLYTGAAGPIMPHAINALFRGFEVWKARHPLDAARFRFHFYGTSYVAPGSGQASVMPLAAEYGLANIVDEIPYRIGHFESLSLQLHTDILVLLGSSDLAYSPSKIYPYFLTEKPLLAVVYRESYLEQLLVKLNCAHTVPFTPGVDESLTSSHLGEFFQIAVQSNGKIPPLPRNRALFESHYLVENLTRSQCAFFYQVTGSGTP